MLVYPGGNRADFTTDNYDFFSNFFSDLGRSESFLGGSNLASRTLFTTALTIIGISLIFYFIAIPFLFVRESKVVFSLIILGSVNGIINAIFYACIGFAPYDLYPDAHVLFVYIAFTSSIAVSIIFTIGFFINKTIPQYLGWIFVGYTILLIGYLILLYTDTSGLENSMLIQVVGQKIIVYAEILTFLIQGIGGLLLVKNRYENMGKNLESQIVKQ